MVQRGTKTCLKNPISLWCHLQGQSGRSFGRFYIKHHLNCTPYVKSTLHRKQGAVNSGLVLMAPEDLHAYMLEVKRYMESNKEMETYFEKNKDVKTFDDYCKLVDALPNFRKAQVAAAGGEGKYRQWVEANRKVQWHIYRDPGGMLIWVHPEGDK